MNFVEKKEIKNSDDRTKLKEANRAYTECISRDFLNKFLAGEKVNANEFCINERVRMEELDRHIYGQLTI